MLGVSLCPIEVARGIRKEIVILTVVLHIRVQCRFNGVGAGVAYRSDRQSFLIVGIVGRVVCLIKCFIIADMRLNFITVIEIGDV